MNKYPEKDRITHLNKINGISTIFYSRNVKGEHGFCYGNTIYLNLESEIPLDIINMHGKLHFYENNKTFDKIKYEVIKNIDNKTYQKLYMDYLMKYYQIYSSEEIEAGAIDTKIVVDILSGINNCDFELSKKVKGYLSDIFEDELNYLTERRYSTFEWSDISFDGIENVDFNNLNLEKSRTENFITYVVKEDINFNEK